MRLQKEFTELDAYFKKQLGFKRQNRTWYKIETDITELVQFQGSTDIEPNFYLNIGLIFNNFEPFSLDRLRIDYNWDLTFRYNLVIAKLNPSYNSMNPHDINLVQEFNNIPTYFQMYIVPLLKKLSDMKYLKNNINTDPLIVNNIIWLQVNREKFIQFLNQNIY